MFARGFSRCGVRGAFRSRRATQANAASPERESARPRRSRCAGGRRSPIIGPPPAFWVADDEEGQARAVAEEVRRLAAEGMPHEEQAILMRAVRTEAARILAALEAAGLPYQVHGGLGLFERREVRVALAYKPPAGALGARLVRGRVGYGRVPPK